MEALLVGQDAKIVVQSMSALEMVEVIVKLAARGSHLDLRFLAHQILGHLFAHVLESKKKVLLHELLGLTGEQVGKWAIELSSSVANNLNDELKDQIIKNLVFLLQHSEVEHTDLFLKMSHLGRRAMNDIRTARPHLETILLFFQVSI